MWKTIIKISAGILLILVSACSRKESSASLQRSDSVKTVTQKDSVSTGNLKSATQYKTYKGAWFDIEYPENFKAENSLKSSTNTEGFDSAIFTSPDGKVQFYVFSPQWSGEPTDISLDKNNEEQIDFSEEKKGDITIKRWLIEANNGSYHRAYEETIDKLSNTNKVFGIIYSPDHYKDEYREEYLHFKKSLKQYAD